MSFLEDASYEWQLSMYKLGLRSTPPIVLPVDASPTLLADVKNVETTYSRTNNIVNAVSDSAKEVGNFLTGSLPLILVLLIVLYFLFKKGFK